MSYLIENINEVRLFVRKTLMESVSKLKSNQYNKSYRFYMLCDKLCNIEGVEVKNQMILDASPINRKVFEKNCAYANELFVFEDQMRDDPSHGFYKSTVKGVSCLYMQYAGFEFIFLKDFEGGKEYWLDESNNLINENTDYYKKWKKANVMLRGISTSELDGFNGAVARFGDGLYMAHLGNKSMAKGYGKVYFVVNGLPKNPKIFSNVNQAEIWIQREIKYKKYKNIRDFNEHTSIKDEMIKLGYDGLEIKGREVVNYTPKDVKYFSNENQLIQYYEDYFENNLSESLLEDYPSIFSMEHFKTLKTFNQRIEYCKNNLKRIGGGSSRIVYKIDGQKVLKLAKNKKGIVQNDTEIDRGNDSYYSSILAKVFDSDDDGLWVEMELATPINKYEFYRLTDFDLKDVGNYLINFQSENNGKGTVVHQQKPLVDRLVNDEFIQLLRDFVAGTDALAGDLGVATSYGLVKRNGHQELVIIDFGLTDMAYEKLYRESYMNENNEVNNSYVYHGTSKGAAYKIQREQSMKPGQASGSPKAPLFFSNTEEYAYSYASRKDSGGGVLLRIKKTPDMKISDRVSNEGGYLEYYTLRQIPIGEIEIKTKNGWIPLADNDFISENINEDNGRELGKSLSSQINTPFITIYRAAPMNANAFFDKDYITLSKKFAIEHAENNHVYHDEPYHVIQALVSTKDVYDAYNPGEYFYSGPDKKAREIYVSLGPNEYEGLDENKQQINNCPLISLTEEAINEIKRYKSSEEFLRAGGLSLEVLDRAAFGFSSEDIKELMPKQLYIKWKEDWKNVKWEQEKSGLNKKQYASKISLEEPIDVSFSKGKFFVEDGHHRLFAAAVLKKPLKVNLEIRDNPVLKLAPELSYDEFHRCIFNQVNHNKETVNEGQTFDDNYDLSKHNFNHGDCDIYAVSLHRLYGYPLYIVRGWFLEPEWGGDREYDYEDSHVVVKLPNGNYMDSDGETTESDLRQNCAFGNNIDKITFEQVSEEEALSTFSCEDQEPAIKQVINYIKSK